MANTNQPERANMESERAVRVLLVEDSEDNQIVYTTILNHCGCIVKIACDGAEGIAMAKSWLPEVILMDINLPKINGWDATRAIKADPVTKNIPVIALTALGAIEDRMRSLECGCLEHLVKPCPPRTVVEEVRRACGRNSLALH